MCVGKQTIIPAQLLYWRGQTGKRIHCSVKPTQSHKAESCMEFYSKNET